MPVRNTLKTRTLFNILGPLANPASPTHGVYGVYTPELLEVYAKTLQQLGHENALVVHGSGLDEIALHGPTDCIYVSKNGLQTLQISPDDFGIAKAPLEAIKGDTPQYNVEAIRKVFGGKGEMAHTHAIAMNAAALLWLHKQNVDAATTLANCFETAMDSIAKGKPLQTIEHAAQISQGNA
jgi:anthranilate phosphoribosyltransferase